MDLKRWLFSQIKNYKYNIHIMKNEIIRHKWEDFVDKHHNYIINNAEQDFNINFNNYIFEDIIKNQENNSTKNLKQVHAKDLFLIDFYNNIISQKYDKRNNNDTNYKNNEYLINDCERQLHDHV